MSEIESERDRVGKTEAQRLRESEQRQTHRFEESGKREDW